MSDNKTFTRFEKSQIMNTAKVLKGFFAKKDSLQKKINDLRAEISAIDEQQRRWEAPIMDLLQGHRIEEVVEYKRELTAAGKYTTKVSLRYPETVLPPETFEPECPSHAGADFDIDKESVAEPQETVPEYDSAGFSTEDGLTEGEPEELAAQVEAGPNEAIPEDDPFFMG